MFRQSHSEGRNRKALHRIHVSMMAERKNIRLDLEYDGSRYHGWQRQAGDVSIQGILEEAIAKMTQDPVTVIASGRTDAGVHALQQVCHFLTYSEIIPESFRRGLNSLIPGDIFIKQAAYVPLDFHARYNALYKTYEYRILNRKEPDLFSRRYAWHIPTALDLEEMKACLNRLQGTHDFSSFRSSGSRNVNPVRTMYRAELHSLRGAHLYLVFEADGFLRHMVRNIVGTLVDAGLGKIDREEFQRILDSRDRQRAGVKAPPQGLFLKGVHYDPI